MNPDELPSLIITGSYLYVEEEITGMKALLYI
jgi:hypothetical protein